MAAVAKFNGLVSSLSENVPPPLPSSLLKVNIMEWAVSAVFVSGDPKHLKEGISFTPPNKPMREQPLLSLFYK